MNRTLRTLILLGLTLTSGCVVFAENPPSLTASSHPLLLECTPDKVLSGDCPLLGEWYVAETPGQGNGFDQFRIDVAGSPTSHLRLIALGGEQTGEYPIELSEVSGRAVASVAIEDDHWAVHAIELGDQWNSLLVWQVDASAAIAAIDQNKLDGFMAEVPPSGGLLAIKDSGDDFRTYLEAAPQPFDLTPLAILARSATAAPPSPSATVTAEGGGFNRLEVPSAPSRSTSGALTIVVASVVLGVSGLLAMVAVRRRTHD